MKTVVYQSYRTQDVPAWLNRCMQSVRAWSDAQQFDYRFIDDRFFDYVPEWYRRQAGANVQVITNLARLLLARELLAAGYERTIWIDADILVFDAEAFRIEVASDFAFCHEVWVSTGWGATIKQAGVNNSVSVFVRGNSFLDFCIWAHEDLVRRGTQILAHGTTTRLLTALYQAVPFTLLTNVGVLSPVVAHDVRTGFNRLAREYAALHGAPIHAINLGGSLCGKLLDGRVLDNDDYDAIVDAMERTRGAMFRPVPGVE
jgi:hypothetical protein